MDDFKDIRHWLDKSSDEGELAIDLRIAVRSLVEVVARQAKQIDELRTLVESNNNDLDTIYDVVQGGGDFFADHGATVVVVVPQ